MTDSELRDYLREIQAERSKTQARIREIKAENREVEAKIRKSKDEIRDIEAVLQEMAARQNNKCVKRLGSVH
tara:strand:+ start:332 stop:547 length:216 start_codon:yes stop_codon:yes gene_type:complete